MEEEVSKFQGQMAKPMKAQIKPPRLMFMNFGSKAVMSVPAEMEFAEMLVPTWANANPRATKKTPALEPLFSESKNLSKTSSGSQYVVPYKIVDAEETRIPIRQVMEKQIGIVKSWDQVAERGVLDIRVKSGSLITKVEKLASEFMVALIKVHASVEP